MLHEKILALRKTVDPVSYHSVKVAEARAKLSTENDLEGEAYFIVWGVKDSHGTIFLKGCCSRSINARGPGSSSNQKILMYWQHDSKDPIGQFLEITEDDYGLKGRWILDDPESVPSAKRARAQIKSGTINQYSVAFNYVWEDGKMKYDEESDSIMISEIDLFQMDPVSRASNSDTHTVRSVEEFDAMRLAVNEDTDDLLKQIPRKFQLELRQIIARHVSLSKVDPAALRATLDKPDPVLPRVTYKKHFKKELR